MSRTHITVLYTQTIHTIHTWEILVFPVAQYYAENNQRKCRHSIFRILQTRLLLHYYSDTFNMHALYKRFLLVDVGKERRSLVHVVMQRQHPFYWNYLEDYWLCAGGPSAVNAIGMQLRDPINSRLTRWRIWWFK